MRIVIDMQGAQTGSRYRGIGRYTLSLAKGMVRNRGKHEIVLALSGLFPETIDSFYEEFDGLLPKENIKIWHAIGPTQEVQSENRQRREVAERIREAFLASLNPDVVLITSLFEGLGDDAIGSIGLLEKSIPTAVILYDLIPLINPDSHFRNSQVHQEWYKRKINSLKRSEMLLAISESARQEALMGVNFDPDSVVNISGACDTFFQSSEEAKGNKLRVWKKFGIEKPFVMYTGGADERKNLHRLIMAYAQLPSKIRKCHQLVFAGKMPDSYIKDYFETAKKCGMIDGELVIAGYVENQDLLTLYNTCALFAFPSLHEGFGIPPLEAMACGAAVIGANATSLPEVIGWTDAMFDPTSVPEITAKLQQALTDKTFHANLVKHGAEQYRKFSWDDSGKKAIIALERFAPQSSAPMAVSLNVEKTATFEPRRLKILAIKLDHLGDFILSIPALTKLRAKYPYASIDIVVGSWNVDFAKKLGIFNRIHAYDYFKKKSSEAPSTTEAILDNLITQLDQYSIAVDLRRQPDTRFLLTRVKADIKVGYQTFNREIDTSLDVAIPTHLDVAHKATPHNETSISVQMIRIVDAIPADPGDFVTYPSICNEINRVPDTVAIFPKAGMDAREWDAAKFSDYVNLLLKNSHIREINVYFSNHADASEFTFKSHDRLNVHIGLKLDILTESLAKNSVCIANNSGGAHLASYLGLTVIGLYSGHEMASEWGPQFLNGYVIQRAAPCSPCHGAMRTDCPYDRFCLTDIPVSDVYNKTLEALGHKSQSGIKLQSDGPTTIRQQKNTDTIVRLLMKSLGSLLCDANQTDLLNLAEIIARNHPTYSLSPDLRSIKYGERVNHRSALIDWVGFSGVEADFRWTDAHVVEMLFDCQEGVSPSSSLTLFFDTLGEQHIHAYINGESTFEGVRSGSNIELELSVHNLRSSSNRLKLVLPNARTPGNGDGRKLALAVRGLLIERKQQVAESQQQFLETA
ncbi:glycosyltransferase [Ralstonia flatus]|uniref:D-inositol-3-phosphate glycosyltransferase n=1 Tax=Ralstonia flatus TaxID=3058601 RepID=A0AAD2CAP2_9RALS|nr:glycosyltransferase [Ralstonia sp. LMG 32965]MBN6209039.1 glycosyltransferase [Ralstonia pickettii]CAJ0891329.1 D-inositol-3-phosphate glycosyltransferase [Ralstonia sp. LMG 32965]CAJ0897695.1 D-inositol-3-phosphate glycosyltransferase [Ralstonia sp. LMG 32965]